MNESEALVEWYWQAKTEVLKQNPGPLPLSTTNVTWTALAMNPGIFGREAGD